MEFLDKVFLDRTVLQWLIALGLIVASFIVGKLVYWILGNIVKKATAKTKTELDDILVDKLEEPLVVALIAIGVKFSIFTLNPPHEAQEWINGGFNFILIITVAWAIARLVDSFFEGVIVPRVQKSENDLDDTILPIVRKGVRFIIWSMGIVMGLDNAGYDIAAVLAGLGIGGLALAMAAKDTVGNIFGGVTVFVDKPFKVNDRIKVGGYDGTIVEIGLRSSRLKTLEGRMVTIPNNKFIDGFVENVSIEPSRKIVLNLGLTYDTTPEQIEQAIELLKDISSKNSAIEENISVGFNNFGDFALGIIFVYYIKKESDILGTQTGMNLEILKKFNENKLEFAFPTQTILAEVQNR